MSDGRKQVLSPFPGGKKQKSWNKTKEKEDKIQLKHKQTDRGSYYQEEWLEEFLDSQGIFYNGAVMQVIMMKTMNSSSYRRVFPLVATKQFDQFFYKN